jgi:hypothetical protein
MASQAETMACSIIDPDRQGWALRAVAGDAGRGRPARAGRDHGPLHH